MSEEMSETPIESALRKQVETLGARLRIVEEAARPFIHYWENPDAVLKESDWESLAAAVAWRNANVEGIYKRAVENVTDLSKVPF
jgi:hypothetical protein